MPATDAYTDTEVFVQGYAGAPDQPLPRGAKVKFRMGPNHIDDVITVYYDENRKALVVHSAWAGLEVLPLVSNQVGVRQASRA